MRTIDKTSIAISGRIINIYKIEGLTFNPRKLVINGSYEIVYKLGSKEECIQSIYLNSTEDYRTLIFRSPHKEMGEIGIPSMNIISLEELG
jgi:hypothetical protein